jgi:hypothetical protein
MGAHPSKKKNSETQITKTKVRLTKNELLILAATPPQCNGTTE